MYLTFVSLLMMSCMLTSMADLLADVQCDEDPVGYIIPDPTYCDRYLDCDPVTGRSIKLCPPGQALDQQRGECEEKAECGTKQLWRKQGTGGPTAIRKVLTRGGPRTFPSPSADPLAALTCQPSKEGYIVHDPEQCDRYADCSPHGVKSYKLCPDGLVLSLDKGVCDFPYKIDCKDRPKLQPSQGKGHCLRENGKFALPAEITCSQYIDCRGGEGHVQGCGVGAVYDEVLGCVHPDQTTRPGCTAHDKYQFKCPTFGLRQRFGDHDRLPHPTNCKLYYACLRNGLPRQFSCEEPTVFNPLTGFCDDQKNVPGCEGYYVKEEVDSVDRDKITQEIREQLLKEFGIPAKSRVSRAATDQSSLSTRTVPLSPIKPVSMRDVQHVIRKVSHSRASEKAEQKKQPLEESLHLTLHQAAIVGQKSY